MLTITVNENELSFNQEHIQDINELISLVNEGVAQHNHIVSSILKGGQELQENDWTLRLTEHGDTTLDIATSLRLEN